LHINLILCHFAQINCPKFDRSQSVETFFICKSLHRLSGDFVNTVLESQITNDDISLLHRVGRVLSFFSRRQNWDSPNPSPAGECAPTLEPGGGEHSLTREGGGRIPIPTRGHTLRYSLYIGALWLGVKLFFKLWKTSIWKQYNGEKPE
jgi:hypothetical protein